MEASMADQRQRVIAAAVATACGIAGGFEGLRTKAYKDPVGIPTICFGSIRGVRMGDTKTEAECHALFTVEMQAVALKLYACVPGSYGLPVNVMSAFSSAAYNLGADIACDPKRSTAARLLRSGDWRAACAQLPRWNKASVVGIQTPLPDLTRRRADEMALCLSPDAPKEIAQ